MGADKKKLLFLLFSALSVSFLLFLTAISGLSTTTYYFTSRATDTVRAGESVSGRRRDQYPPSFAYYIYGGRGDKERMFRLLLAVYHPRNQYLLHLAMDAPANERDWLAAALMSVPAIQAFGNVDVIGKPGWLTYMGGTNLAETLKAVAVLLKLNREWDWFITLSALDYPLLTQDDLSYVFSTVSRDLNFVDHTSDLGWKEKDRIRPIVVDPSLYLARRSQIFTATEKRPMPEAFKVFTGSPWVMLSRSFLEYCIFGWENLPRTILMYFNNIVLPQEGYFHTVVCNSPEFRNTTVNSDLRYMIWDNPPKMEPRFLNVSIYDQMAESGALFARKFQTDDPVLTMVDEKILKRRHNRVVPGAWCTKRDSLFTDQCSYWGDLEALKPGPQAKSTTELSLQMDPLVVGSEAPIIQEEIERPS
ncbi:hypothetical protein V2J09_012767 [Rumex salicifolius]